MHASSAPFHSIPVQTSGERTRRVVFCCSQSKTPPDGSVASQKMNELVEEFIAQPHAFCKIFISYSHVPHSRRLFKLYFFSFSLSLHLSNIISVIRSSFFQNKAGWRACLALLSGTHSAKGPPSGTSSNDFRKIVRVYIPPIFIDILMHSINVIVYLWGSSASSSEDVIFGRSKRGPSPSFMPHQVGKRGCLCLAISLKLQPL